MHEVVVAAAVFCCLLVSSLASLTLWPAFDRSLLRAVTEMRQ